jgi:hypothetical protein
MTLISGTKAKHASIDGASLLRARMRAGLAGS